MQLAVMADEFDRAQEISLQAAEQAREAQRIKAAMQAKLTPRGECQNPLCGETLTKAGQLFCGPACAQEHAKRVK